MCAPISRRGARSIRAGAVAAAEAEGGEAVIDPAVLDEVTALTEWPVPLVGAFEPRFLELPPEVLIATMQDHQRYFPVRAKDGKLMPRFIAVANLESRDPAQVRAGNERVVRPRLADAAFFFAADRKATLQSRRQALGAVTFQAQLGSYADKTARITALAGHIARVAGHDPATAQRAAEISKCDLLTAMVGEFPELQGVMGRHYAQHDGESAGRCRHRRAVHAPLRGRCPAHDGRRARARHGRQARHPGRHLRHRPEADRDQGSVWPSPRGARGAAIPPSSPASRSTCASSSAALSTPLRRTSAGSAASRRPTTWPKTSTNT